MKNELPPDNLLKSDLFLIAGKFLEFDLPRDRAFLLRYFNTILQRAWILYFYCFGHSDYFQEHAGIYTQKRIILRMIKQHDYIIDAWRLAKKEMDFDKIVFIESGKMSVPHDIWYCKTKE